MTASEEEVAVLGAVLIDKAAWMEICDYLDENDFCSEQHRLIWRACRAIADDGAGIDDLSVTAKLKDHRCLERAGGRSYINMLVTTLPDVANVKFYADQVKKGSLSRDLMHIGEWLLDPGTQPRETLSRTLEKLVELSERAVLGVPKRIGALSEQLLAEVLKRDGLHANGIKTGFSDLDGSLWGMFPGDLILLAARPSIGKSAFALQVAAQVARQGRPSLFISLEMSESQLTRRLLSSYSGVPYQRILQSQHISQENEKALIHAQKIIATIPLSIDDRSGQTLHDLRLKARREQSRQGLDLMVVDYLQLLAEKKDDFHAISEVSSGLKSLAKDLQIPILAVSQMRRAPQDNRNERPTLDTLRGSGQLEQDADVVMFLWHPDTGNRNKIEVFIEKHRNGPLGSAKFWFDNNTTLFCRGDEGEPF